MHHIQAEELALATGGRLIQCGTRRIATGLCTDTRALREGCIFCALVGGNFDGNNFALKAAEQGAAALILSRLVDNLPADCCVVLVEDTLVALQELARWWRQELEPLLVLGLTGSCGKTSTKDMLVSILKQRMRSEATLGNLNNHIGVPLSILRAELGLEAAVWEMGMNHPGEIAPLCELTRPHIGIITNVGTAHIEFMGSRENIAHEKCSLARSLPPEGALIYPALDDFADYIASQSKAKCVPVGGEDSPVRASHIESNLEGSRFILHIAGLGEMSVELPITGEHMVSNSLLAAAAAWQAGCSLEDIARGLRTIQLTQGRLSCYTIDGINLVDDSYNANLESMKAALQTVANYPMDQKRYALLGRMGELGDFSLEAHRELGAFIAQLPYSGIITVGPDNEDLQALRQELQNCPTYHACTHEEAAAILRPQLATGDCILFKGSRSAHLERSLLALFPQLSNQLTPHA